MLIGLQIFILFVNQLDDLGKVNYGVTTALIFVFITNALSGLFVFSYGMSFRLFKRVLGFLRIIASWLL